MTATITLSTGASALVDDADREAVLAAGPWYPCSSDKTTYAMTNARKPDGTRTTISLHRFLMVGVDRVDHINGDGLDNRRANLRPATGVENARNQRCSNRTGFKGVAAVTRTNGKPWMARIWHSGRLHHLGTFDTTEEAAHAYDAAAIEHFGEFARLNFPEERTHVDH